MDACNREEGQPIRVEVAGVNMSFVDMVVLAFWWQLAIAIASIPFILIIVAMWVLVSLEWRY